jgi:hypothetical protein
MAFCQKCGAKLGKDGGFCPKCGSKNKQSIESSTNGKNKVPINVFYIIISTLMILFFFLGLLTAETACKGYREGSYISFPSNGICESGEITTFGLGFSAMFLVPFGIFLSIVSLIGLVFNLKKKKYGYMLYASIAGLINTPVLFLGFSEYGLKAISILVLPTLMIILSILDFKK